MINLNAPPSSSYHVILSLTAEECDSHFTEGDDMEDPPVPSSSSLSSSVKNAIEVSLKRYDGSFKMQLL